MKYNTKTSFIVKKFVVKKGSINESIYEIFSIGIKF